ncbi:MAG: hypothetical protein AAB676_08195 [Verrucomicrobiota bacterium]
MPLPTLNRDGLLPASIHDCTFDELKAGLGSFQGNDQRPRLFARLEGFLAEARAAGLVRCILVDGSFVTSKPDPNDIDLVAVVSSGHDFAADLLPSQYNVLSKFRVRKRFGFDMVAVREDTTEFDEAAAFFQQVRNRPHLRKGILRLNL